MAHVMHVSDVRRLYDYHYWANAQLMDVVTQLTPEQFTREVAGSYGSIRNTLVHVLSAEWGWLERCGGPPRGERLRPEAFPAVQTVTDTWSGVEAQMRRFLEALGDEDLARPIEFSMAGGATHVMPMGHLLQHAAIHAVHHRGQVALLLRMLGVAPGNFDLLFHREGEERLPA